MEQDNWTSDIIVWSALSLALFIILFGMVVIVDCVIQNFKTDLENPT